VRVIDSNMEIWRRCIQAKRAMFGLRSNFSPHYAPVTFFGNTSQRVDKEEQLIKDRGLTLM